MSDDPANVAQMPLDQPTAQAPVLISPTTGRMMPTELPAKVYISPTTGRPMPDTLPVPQLEEIAGPGYNPANSKYNRASKRD